MRQWTVQEARAALLRRGLAQSLEAVEFVEGENCIVFFPLPNDKIAWFPTTAEGQRRLVRERRVLRLLERYCHFSAPRVVYEDDTGWDLRTFVRGFVRPTYMLERIQSDANLAHQLGEDLGRILAEQHTCIPPEELEGGWLPRVKNWPRPEDLSRLPEIVQDSKLLERINLALERRAAVRDYHPVLVHADLGLHNVVVDPDTLRVTGVIDWEDPVFGDRHQDFAFMVFQRPEEPMLEGALSAYEPAVGMKIDRDRVLLLNAVAAIGFLGFRYGHAPEEAWCGRTLEQDLAWTHKALAIAGL
ncbi:MAG TPA: phosphotransferase [Steroidobacteraceae bacterium]|nr:phosphotransferase [Steroidobacteraceae bacterium]